MILSKFTLDDYEDVVDMFYMFINDVFNNRKINAKYFFYKEVEYWIKNGYHIILAKNRDGINVGFTMCRIDNLSNLTEDVYVCDYCYVKEDYRNTRASYMLYKNGYNYAIENNLQLVVSGRINNGVSNMIEKHFNLKEKFKLYEGVNNE